MPDDESSATTGQDGVEIAEEEDHQQEDHGLTLGNFTGDEDGSNSGEEDDEDISGGEEADIDIAGEVNIGKEGYPEEEDDEQGMMMMDSNVGEEDVMVGSSVRMFQKQ